jgi:cell division protein FtsL
MDALEYAVRKPVHNRPIVREIDRTRQRELWRSAAIGALVVGVALFAAWQQFELRRHGYRTEQLRLERAAEEETNRHLRLEIETLRSPSRIEALATGHLKLVAPGCDDAIVLERVVPAEPPPKSVVAAR